MDDFDFEPPSFSLGIDLDLQSQLQTTSLPDSTPRPAKRPSTASNLRTIGDVDDGDFESPVRVSDPPRALKRLRPGPKSRPVSEGPKVEYEDQCCNEDDEIEDPSSDEDCPRANSHLSSSVCSSSKPSLHRQNVVTSECGKQYNSRNGEDVANASASINVETRGSPMIFPKLTVSPLRRFQLIDSDSDDPSTTEDAHQEMPSVILSSEDKNSDYCKQEVLANQGTETSISKHKTKDLWKDFCPEKSNRIPTPAFDEFCEEYFSGLKNKSVPKIDHDTECGRKTDETSLPPAHFYFFHSDSRIQKLVRERLPHFFPLEVGNDQEYKQQNISVIDYMGQFGTNQVSRQASRRQNVEKSSSASKKNTTRSKKNNKNVPVDSISEHSDNWVTPKSSAGMQKNAGNRRVQAVSGSSGHWYTGQDGRRVYVTKKGQELTGAIAYSHYRKESGKGVMKSSKKKTAAKKKTASAKK